MIVEVVPTKDEGHRKEKKREHDGKKKKKHRRRRHGEKRPSIDKGVSCGGVAKVKRGSGGLPDEEAAASGASEDDDEDDDEGRWWVYLLSWYPRSLPSLGGKDE
jgi:hypothetical protein